jgi:hypothetical protein
MLLLAGGLVWACAMTGCAPSTVPSIDADGGPRREPPPDREVGPDAPWPFWPQRMRVHPLSQFVTDRSSGERLIEVRIEFTDTNSNTSKAVGLMDIELHDGDAPPQSEPITRWTADLWDLEVNSERYDDVTRTYLFSLRIEDHPVPATPELRVYFLSADGGRLQAAYRLKPPTS